MNNENFVRQYIKFQHNHDDDARGTYNSNSQIKVKTAIVKPISCDQSDAHTLVQWKTTVFAQGEAAVRQETNKQYSKTVLSLH